MIFHSRVLYANQNRKTINLSKRFLISLIILTGFLKAYGTEQVFNDFSELTDSSNIAIALGGSFYLDDQYKILIKVYGDTIRNSSIQSSCPDVISTGPDTFQFYYIANTSKALFKSAVRITPDGVNFDNTPQRIYNTQQSNTSFLHASKGDNGEIISYVESSSSVTLTIENGSERTMIDSSTTYGYIGSSQCHLAGDTFLIANSVDATELKLRKIYSRNQIISVVQDVQIEKDTLAERHLTNCAVSYDNNDLILVVWSRGPPTAPREMHYRFFNRAMTSGAGGILDRLVCDNSLYHYDDVVIRSYGPGKFAVIFWNSSGVGMYKLTNTGGVVQESYSQIFNKSGLKHCAAALKNNIMAIVVNGDLDGDGKPGIEGEIFDFNDGTLSNGVRLRFSDTIAADAKILNNNSTAINCAIDDKGSIAVTWRDSSMVQGSVFARRGVKYQQGYWVSRIFSLSDSANDSIRIYPLELHTTKLNQNNWYVQDSIRFGNTVEQCSSAPWRSFSSDTLLTTMRFYQICITLNRKTSGDSLKTPLIDSAVVRWNVKPRFKCIDSVVTGTGTLNNVNFGDTLHLLARKDTANLFLSVYDPDHADIIRIQGSGASETSLKTVLSGPVFKTSLKILPVPKSDTVIVCNYYAYDAKNWYAASVNLKVKTRNSTPVLNASIVKKDGAGNTDTLPLPLSQTLVLQQDEWIDFLYSVSDTNDPLSCKAIISRIDNNKNIRFDSATGGIRKAYRLKAADVSPVDTVIIRVTGMDVDTSVHFDTRIIINHPPVIRYCRIDNDTFNHGDTVRVAMQKENRISVAVDDTDCFFWDSLSFRFRAGNQQEILYSGAGETQYSYAAQRSDSSMQIVVSDKYGKADSILFFIKFPWLEDDTSVNHDYRNALNRLYPGPSLVIGDGIGDTVKLPLSNSGNDSMHFTGLEFRNDSRFWLSVSIIQDRGYTVFNSGNNQSFKPVSLLPDSTIWLVFLFSDTQMQGDGLVRDTVVLYTSDPSHTEIVIPVQMEYNDLPRIISVNPWFPSDVPYKAFAKQRVYRPYWFPPHASISLSFSEPIDSVSAHRGIKVYSIADSMITGRAQMIDLHYIWSQNYTKVDLRPSYKVKSAKFGILPPDGLFIPTDSIALVISTELTDRASTPGGPNRFDYNNDFRRDENGDTMLSMRVDSITFSLLSVTPSPGDSSISTRPEITLLFNAPVYAASVDTARKNNSSLVVYSKYNGNAPLEFDSISVDSCKVRFRIGRYLFYGDSLWCSFRDKSVRDMMGFPSDNNDDGIAASLFDTASTQDNLNWGYTVRKVHIISVTPDSGEKVKDGHSSIKITFSDSLPESVFDMSSENNRSLCVRSRYSDKTISFKSIEIAPDHRSITFQPEAKFFSNDSVYCSFAGLTKNYRYSNALNIPSGGDGYAAKSWHFFTGNIGFYTYPNPYKPGKNHKHCSAKGPCGIWFKNLHELKRGIADVKIRIFSMNAHPVFDSEKAGETIHFEFNKGEPQWLWNTRNQAGELVGSGLYFYVIYDLKGNVLIKGKLMIVR
jgi:hypothetical protein